ATVSHATVYKKTVHNSLGSGTFFSMKNSAGARGQLSEGSFRNSAGAREPLSDSNAFSECIEI
ncbi:MAG: hypothetical protein WD423_12880, partial [Rhodothermales bacterium]